MSATPAGEPTIMRTVVADSEPIVRGALRVLGAQGLGLRVVGEAGTPAALQREVEVQQPDLVIVAWNLLATPADAALDALRSAAKGLRVVVLGQRPDMREAAMRAGADSYLSKVDPPAVVLSVLRCRLQNESFESNEPGGTS
jgi:DNA-binding NarL/FixJ family response regulator